MKFGSLIQIAGAAAIAVLLATPAGAQTQAASGRSIGGGGDGGMPVGIDIGGGSQVDDATLEKRREIERAYKDATHKIPAQQAATNDPWANMRGADEAKPAAKPAAKTAQKKKPAQ